MTFVGLRRNKQKGGNEISIKKIKFTKEEKKAQERKLHNAVFLAKELLNAALETGITICAQKAAGEALGLDMEEFKKESGEDEERLISLSSPYQDWKLSFQFNDLGSFKLKCGTYELRREAVLDHSDMNSFLKIFVEQPELRRFFNAIWNGVKEKKDRFNEPFEQNIRVASEEVTKEQFAQAIRLLATQMAKTLKKHAALQESDYHLRKPTLYLPGEKTLFGKIPGEEAREAIAQGLQV